jgi:ubiquinone/menaquinone biosynthesis C-methylase UbiE
MLLPFYLRAKVPLLTSAQTMSYTLNFPDQQPRVDNYFESAALHWRQLYRDVGLKPAIFSYRQSVALNWMAESVALKDSEVLDVGCGAGPATVALAQRGARVKAIDTVNRMVDLTRQSANEAGVAGRVIASLGDVHALNFADNSFDAAVVIGVIYWLHSPRQALAEILRVLKPGGHLVVSADNALRLTYALDPAHLPWVLAMRRTVSCLLRSLKWRHPDPSIPVNKYSVDQFDRLISDVGFQKLKSLTVGFGPFSFCECNPIPDLVGIKLHRLFQRLAERGCPPFAGRGNHYVVLARKPA